MYSVKPVGISYAAIQKVVLLPETHSKGYFTYRAKFSGKIPFHALAWFYEDAFDGATVDDWLAEVKKHNPNVKIKRYKSRWWIF